MIGEEGKKMDDEAKAPAADLLKRVDKHLTDWLEQDLCECEGPGHSCGKTEVEKTRDEIRALSTLPPAAAPGQPQAQERLRAFCEGLEMENIDRLMDAAPEVLKSLGEEMAKRVKARMLLPQAPQAPERLSDAAFILDLWKMDLFVEEVQTDHPARLAWDRIRTFLIKSPAPESAPKQGGEA